MERLVKRKKINPESSNSLKTFYIYTGLVLIVIIIALLIRGFFLFQQSIFDPNHHFTFALVNKGSVEKVVAINPQIPSLTILEIGNDHIPYAQLAKNYGIATEGYIEVNESVPINGDLHVILWDILRNSYRIDSNMTVFDYAQILLSINEVTTSNTIIEKINLVNTDTSLNSVITRALTDPTLASERVSIQIINTTEVSGLGQRLGLVLTNKGANVVDISSSGLRVKNSSIIYYGDKSYTLQKIEKMLGFQVGNTNNQPIADIVITLGEDSRSSTAF